MRWDAPVDPSTGKPLLDTAAAAIPCLMIIHNAAVGLDPQYQSHCGAGSINPSQGLPAAVDAAGDSAGDTRPQRKQVAV